MRVFVAGATGALGRPVVRRLVARGHEVTGLTRSPDRAAIVESLGAEPSVADALDAAELRAAVIAARPQAVLHLLTRLGGRTLRRGSDLAETNALRTTATHYLLDAASAAAAQRFVAESMVFAYGYGDLGEAPLPEDAIAAARADEVEVRASVEAVRSLEAQVLAASRAWRLEGIVVRLGVLYGPGASDEAVEALRRRALPLPGGGRSHAPLVHVEDAAEAIVLALERGRRGEVYNVADAEGADLRAFYAALADTVHAPRPRSLPRWLANALAPYGAIVFRTRLAVSSEKARRELSWAPRYPSWRDGLATLAPAPG